jgi:uncharacterized protein (TIGR02646 family)
MKYIRKTEPPPEFTGWKAQGNENWQPTWDNLRNDRTDPSCQPKRALHNALLREQGFICCYCGRRIGHISSHIEHFKPRKLNPELELDYSNLLASCPGYPESEDAKSMQVNQPAQKHCGQKKGSWYNPKQLISPLLENCEAHFRYTAAGEICPNGDATMRSASQTTIERLGLNHSTLAASRKIAIEAILLETDSLTAEEIQTLIQSYRQPDANGEYVRFCGVVLYFLHEYWIQSDV